MIASPRHLFGLMLALLVGIAFVYIIGPLLVIIAASFGDTGFLAFPPQGFSLRHYESALTNPRYVNGFFVSLRIAAIVTLLSVAIALAAAYALVRGTFPGARTIEAVLLSPLLLPGLVLAVALTLFFSRHPWARGSDRLILAHLTICVPCALRVMIPVLERFDRALEEAAQNLGASPIQAFFLVTLPVIRPGVLAAAALAFILSFDEVEMAVFLAHPREQPLTVALYSAVQMSLEPSLAAVSAILIAIVFAVMLLWQLATLRRGGR
jgi:putative spermidine/putrescine transport system permease protein